MTDEPIRGHGGWQKPVKPPRADARPPGLPPKKGSVRESMLENAVRALAFTNETVEGAVGTVRAQYGYEVAELVREVLDGR